jgi:hypothetical protein
MSLDEQKKGTEETTEMIRLVPIKGFDWNLIDSKGTVVLRGASINANILPWEPWY